MSNPASPLGTLTARLEERILQPLRSNAFARRTWFSVTIALVLAIYCGLIAWYLRRDAADPPRAAEAQETPVEIVAEMPQPPAPQAAAPRQPAEKPASSAPRAVNDSEVETGEDKDSHAPKKDATKNDATKSDAKPAQAQPRPDEAPSKEAAASAPTPAETAQDVAEPPKPEPPKPDLVKPDLAAKDAEALDRAVPQPPKKPQKLAKAKSGPHTAKSAAQQFAGASELQDFTFAKPMRKRARVSGGTEDDRYLAVVYGLITQSRRPVSYPYGEWAVDVSFMVDGGGNLIGAEVSRPSGYPDVDAQAVQAVEDAAPFPPPPSGGNTGMVARLRSAGAPDVLGER